MSKRAQEAAENIGYIGMSFRDIQRFKEGVKAGYEQAQKDTIERMIKWLKVHAKDYIVNMTGSYPDAPFDAIIGEECWDELIKQLKEEEK